MTPHRLILARALVIGLFLVQAAGTSLAATPAQQTGTPPAGSRIAVFYSDLFQDSKKGILRLTAAADALNREFQPRQTELDLLSKKLTQFQEEVLKSGSSLPRGELEAKYDQLEAMKRDYQRKGEDAKAAFEKRKDVIYAPLQEAIGKALEAYAKARGITLLIDGSAMPLVFVDDAIDVTAAFVKEFNSKNPAQ